MWQESFSHLRVLNLDCRTGTHSQDQFCAVSRVSMYISVRICMRVGFRIKTLSEQVFMRAANAFVIKYEVVKNWSLLRSDADAANCYYSALNSLKTVIRGSNSETCIVLLFSSPPLFLSLFLSLSLSTRDFKVFPFSGNPFDAFDLATLMPTRYPRILEDGMWMKRRLASKTAALRLVNIPSGSERDCVFFLKTWCARVLRRLIVEGCERYVYVYTLFFLLCVLQFVRVGDYISHFYWKQLTRLASKSHTFVFILSRGDVLAHFR